MSIFSSIFFNKTATEDLGRSLSALYHLGYESAFYQGDDVKRVVKDIFNSIEMGANCNKLVEITLVGRKKSQDVHPLVVAVRRCCPDVVDMLLKEGVKLVQDRRLAPQDANEKDPLLVWMYMVSTHTREIDDRQKRFPGLVENYESNLLKIGKNLLEDTKLQKFYSNFYQAAGPVKKIVPWEHEAINMFYYAMGNDDDDGLIQPFSYGVMNVFFDAGLSVEEIRKAAHFGINARWDGLVNESEQIKKSKDEKRVIQDALLIDNGDNTTNFRKKKQF